MKHLTTIAAVLLGLIFGVLGLDHFFHFMPPMPQPSADSPPGKFFAAIAPTGYFTFVKLLEVIGGVLVVLPASRNAAMLILGPIIVNIWCFHIFLTRGQSLSDPKNAVMMAIITASALIVLNSGRKAWAGLIKG